MPGRPARAAALATGAALLALLPASGGAVSLPDRTQRISVTPAGTESAGVSQDPVVATDGRTVVFATTGADLVAGDANGPVADVVAIDRFDGARRLVSEAPGGADGPSGAPAVSGDGAVVAFESTATNLVPGDANGQADVFARDRRGPLERLSVAADGGPADGPSTAPDVSSDGRYVVFVSAATNLVAGDTNGQPDVFVRDRQAQTTRLVSVARDGGPADGRSGGAAISGDGRFVAFESDATNLTAGADTNKVADVVVRDLQQGRTERVSTSTAGAQQNAAVKAPFRMQPDISRDGRLVVWDSDATNLVRTDRNQRTDVFLRDRRRNVTTLVSASTTNVQGDNDSFGPRITAGGRFLTFQSFAGNLVPRGEDGPREDVFVRDLEARTTSIGSVTAGGATRAPELGGQFLTRPSVSNDGTVLVWASTSPNLVAGDGNGVADVLLRRLDPPATRLVARPAKGRPEVRVAADDPRATRFVCRLDGGDPFTCGAKVDLADRIGRVLRVRAGGPGLLDDPAGVTVRLWDDRRRPSARIVLPRGRSLRVVRGTATDRGPAGVARVDVAVLFFSGGRCRRNTGKAFEQAPCERLRFVTATGRSRWSLRLPRSIRGPIAIVARATDRAGNRSPQTVRRFVLG
jgi:Tol biopolymer transport system component